MLPVVVTAWKFLCATSVIYVFSIWVSELVLFVLFFNSFQMA